MSGLANAVIAIVGDAPGSASLRAALAPVLAARLGEADVQIVATSVEEFWSALSPACVLVILLGIDPPLRAVAFVRELRADERTRCLPRLAVASEAEIPRLARAGGLTLVAAETAVDEIVALATELLPHGERASAVVALEERVLTLGRELEEARRDQGVLVHDVRVLLAVTYGFGCNLRDGIVGPLGAEARASVARILAATEDATAILDAASASPGPSHGSESASRRARRKHVRLDELVTATTSLLGEMATDVGVALSTRVEDPVAAWCDPLQVKQIVVNLVVNALKFTPSGGRVDVRLGRFVPVAAEGVAARAVAALEVADSGPGISAADRARVFDHGVRLDRHADVPGQGIGLAIVSALAAAHQGSVQIEDSPLGGARFVVKLPLDLRKREGSAP